MYQTGRPPDIWKVCVKLKYISIFRLWNRRSIQFQSILKKIISLYKNKPNLFIFPSCHFPFFSSRTVQMTQKSFSFSCHFSLTHFTLLNTTTMQLVSFNFVDIIQTNPACLSEAWFSSVLCVAQCLMLHTQLIISFSHCLSAFSNQQLKFKVWPASRSAWVYSHESCLVY